MLLFSRVISSGKAYFLAVCYLAIHTVSADSYCGNMWQLHCNNPDLKNKQTKPPPKNTSVLCCIILLLQICSHLGSLNQ